MRPLVAIVNRGDVPPAFLDLLVALRPMVSPAAFDASVAEQFAAAIVSAPAFLDDVPRGLPVAVWVESRDDVEALSGVDGVVAVVAANDAVLQAAGSNAVRVPRDIRRLPEARYVPPIVRSRLRQSRRLPCHAIVVADERGASWCDAPLDGDDRDSVLETAFACAAAAIVRGADIVRAMAWGLPIVTDEASRAHVGATDGVEVLVAEAGKEARVVVSILEDDRLAARLSWRARRFYETRFDSRDAVRTLQRRWGLLSHGTAAACVEAVLEELWTPWDAPVALRVPPRLAPAPAAAAR